MGQRASNGHDLDDSQPFWDILSNVNSAPCRSSTATGPYSLISEPPVVEISRSLFENKLAEYYGDDIEHIAANPQKYSHPVSQNAQHTANVAFRFGTKAEGCASAYSWICTTLIDDVCIRVEERDCAAQIWPPRLPSVRDVAAVGWQARLDVHHGFIGRNLCHRRLVDLLAAALRRSTRGLNIALLCREPCEPPVLFATSDAYAPRAMQLRPWHGRSLVLVTIDRAGGVAQN